MSRQLERNNRSHAFDGEQRQSGDKNGICLPKKSEMFVQKRPKYPLNDKVSLKIPKI